MSVESLFLNGCVTKLRSSMDRIAVCLGKLSDDQLWARGHNIENAVGNLVLHLAGNVRQWVISGLGGAPDTRVREQEFLTDTGMTAAQLTTTLKDVVDQAIAVISSLSTEQLTRIYSIQERQPSGVEAVLNVVEHLGQHTGQIIFITKNLTGEDLALLGPRTRQAN